MAKKYIVRLTTDERSELENVVNKGKIAAYKRLHAQILLKADISPDGSAWTDKKIGEAFNVNVKTIERIRQRLVEKGIEGTINRAKSSKCRQKKIDGELEAHLVALTCSEAPEGQARWTLRLLADKMVELEYVNNISHETIRQVLKKNELKPWQKKEGCIPPETNANESLCYGRPA